MTDERAFSVGKNLALTAGDVVYRNTLIELIQYRASTPTVHRRPLVIVPPCINKYYILDLQPENSFVRWAVAQGHTVFIVSWRNIAAEQGSATWDDYIDDGVLAALRVAREISGSASVNTLGYCVGGTLLASALAVLAARGDRSAATMTLFATAARFRGVRRHRGVRFARRPCAARTAADGGRPHPRQRDRRRLRRHCAPTISSGTTWCATTSRARHRRRSTCSTGTATRRTSPGRCTSTTLRNMYLDNLLREPGALTMAGERVDLSTLTLPTYLLATRDDHIVPWRSAYRGTALLGTRPAFVLAGSGHISPA